MTKLSKILLFLFCLICLFCFIGTRVNAQEIVQTSYFDSSVNNNYQGSITYQHTTYTATPLNQNGSLKHLFENVGNGYINFTLYVDNGASGTNQLYEITLNGSNNSVYQCNFNLNMYKDNTSQTGLTSVQCPVALNNSYINRITLKRTDIWGTTNIVFSNLWSFTSSKDASTTIQEQMNANLNIIGQEIRNNGAKLDNISTILSTLTTNSTNTINAINNQSQQQHQDSQNINNSIQDTNNTLKDSSIDNNNTSSSTSEWNNKVASNGTITNLLTLPIQLMQGYVNGMNSSCTPFNLGTLFGTTIILPCINVGALIGSSLWSVIDVLFSGFMIFGIAKKLIKIFNDFTNMKSNQVDELYGGGA